MKRTVLYDIHKESGALFGEYNNYILPSVYPSSDNNWSNCTIEDCSYISTFVIKGKDAASIINNTFYFNSKSVDHGHCKSGWFSGNSMERITEITLFRLEDEIYAVALNNIYHELLINYIKGLNYIHYRIIDYRDKIFKISIAGIYGEDLLKMIYGEEIFFNFSEGQIKGDFLHRGVLIARTEVFELYFPVDDAMVMWQILLEKGRALGIRAIGYMK